MRCTPDAERSYAREAGGYTARPRGVVPFTFEDTDQRSEHANGLGETDDNQAILPPQLYALMFG